MIQIVTEACLFLNPFYYRRVVHLNEFSSINRFGSYHQEVAGFYPF